MHLLVEEEKKLEQNFLWVTKKDLKKIVNVECLKTCIIRNGITSAAPFKGRNIAKAI